MAHFLAHLGETNPDVARARRRRARRCCCSGSGCCRTGRCRSFVVVGGIVAVPLLGLGERGVTLLGEVPQGLPTLGLPAVQACRPQRAAAAGDGLLPARRGRDGGDRAHVRRASTATGSTATRSSWRSPAPNLAAGLGQRLPGERRHVAVAGQRERRRAHAALGARRVGDPARGRALLLGPAARPAAAGARRDRARGRDGPVQGRRAAAAVALQPRRVRRRDGRAARRARLRAAARRADRRGALDAAAAAPRVAAATHRARPRPRHRLLRRRDPPSGERARCRTSSSSAAEASLLYFNVDHVRDRFFELLRARGDGVRLAVFFLGSCPAIDLAGASCSRSCTTRCASGASPSGWPRPAATCARRCAAPDSRSTASAVVAEPAGGDGRRGVAQ